MHVPVHRQPLPGMRAATTFTARFATAVMLILMLLMLACLPMASAQSSARTAPAAIAVQDILKQADEDQQLVDFSRQLLAAPSPFNRLRGALDAIAEPVNAKLLTTQGAALRELPIMRLESLDRHWEFDARRYAR